MPYHPGFHARQETRQERVDRQYDNLAAFSKRIAGIPSGWLSRNSEEALRSEMVRARLIDADGVLRHDRYQRWMHRKGFDGYLPDSPDADESMLEGGSP